MPCQLFTLLPYTIDGNVRINTRNQKKVRSFDSIKTESCDIERHMDSNIRHIYVARDYSIISDRRHTQKSKFIKQSKLFDTGCMWGRASILHMTYLQYRFSQGYASTSKESKEEYYRRYG